MPPRGGPATWPGHPLSVSDRREGSGKRSSSSDPSGPGRLLFAFFAAMAETERENVRESTLEGLDAAARKGKHGGRPPVITEDMLHTVLRRRANGESVEQIQPDLIIPTGKRKGQAASVASIYRALAEHEKKEAYAEAVEAAHADFADLQDVDGIPRPRRVRIRRPDDPLTLEEAARERPRCRR
ncbi:recombinase family protein [Streptomyces milbemycinicus]|uniref:recombinase family protein n=1 Tax=Streptomyces milbemycinicus TaxID=476552 RepID=UPI0033F0ADE4